MAAAVSFSAFLMVNQRQVEGMDMLTRLLFMSFFAAIAITFFQEPQIVWDGTLLDGLWIYGLILGVFGIIVPILFFSIGIPKIGTGMASILSAIELPVAVTVSMLLLHEHMSVLQITGIVIILIGMTLPSIANRRIRLKNT